MHPPPTASSDWISAMQLPGDSEVGRRPTVPTPEGEDGLPTGPAKSGEQALPEQGATPWGGKGGGGSQCQPPPYR